MLADVLVASARYAADLDLEPVLAFHPPEGVNDLIPRTPKEFRLHEQRGFDLSERMANAFAQATAAGAEIVVLRGSDSPAMGFSVVEEAVLQLQAGMDVVISPDLGGGYALICGRNPGRGLSRELFDVPMSTSDVLSQTLSRATDLGLRTHTTSASFDLDCAEDLTLLDEFVAKESSDLCRQTVEVVLRFRESGVL